jgi:hypothetical protein
MARLIQSKQIEGIVTASVIQGDFLVSGSLVVSGSGIFTNDITASSISSSGPIYGVRYSDVQGIPNFVPGTGINITQVGNNITITNTSTIEEISGFAELISSVAQLNSYTGSNDIIILGLEQFTSSIDSRVTALENATDLTGSDSQTLSIVGDQLSISSGNTITIPTGSGGGVSSWNDLTDIPSDLVSGSVLRTLDGTSVISSSQQILDLGFVTSSGVGSSVSVSNTAPTSPSEGDLWWKSDDGNLYVYYDGYWVISIDNTSAIPTGTVSGSSQLTQSFDERYALSGSVGEGEGDITFDGNRIVSNTLLGDLYSQSFNAGTSGSIQEFLNSVFFPQTAPTAEFTNQTANFNTNLATDTTNLVSVSLTDTVDNSPYTLVLSGTNASSLTAVPTNSDSSSWEIRANGDLTAGTYSYNVTVGDSTDSERTYSGRSIIIAQATTGTMGTNGTFYIIESATSGVITLSSTGRPGSTAAVSVSYTPNYGTQVATNFQSSNPLISINSSNGQLSVGTPISGSENVSGDTITSNITFNDQYGNNGSGSISVNVTTNNAPDIVFSNSSLLNTNQATGSSGTLVTISFTDTEGDAINHDSFTFTDPSNQLQSSKSGNNYLVTATSDLSASNYTITCSVEDIHGFRTNTETHTFSISQADTGTLNGDTSIYIIESAVSGDSFRDATGFNNGNPANISVSYSPNYGSQIATISSSNPTIVVDGSGNLTLGVDLSGSVTQSGDSFTSLISWEDQYGNQDSASITATVFGNQSPSVTFTDNGLTDVTAISGSNIGSLSITDIESNSPFGVTIGGTDGGIFNIIPQNNISSSWIIQPTGSLSIGEYSVQFLVTDNYSETTTLNENISVSSATNYGSVYVYDSGQYVGDGDVNYLNNLGASEGSGTPPSATTSFSGFGFLEKIEDGSLGNLSFTYDWGGTKTATLLASGSGENLHDVLSQFGHISKASANRFFIIFPSNSGMSGIPTSMIDSYGGSTLGQYVLEVGLDGATIDGVNTIEPSKIHSITLGSSIDGYTSYYVIGNYQQISSGTSIYLGVNSSSGSGGI